MDESETYDDNILVGKRSGGADFFRIYLGPTSEDRPYAVSLTRYTVPGRFDLYVFDWVPGSSGVGSRIRYFSDPAFTLDKALRMLQTDLNKKQVVDLLVEACTKAPRILCRQLVEIVLPIVAPSSAALRACRRVLKARRT